MGEEITLSEAEKLIKHLGRDAGFPYKIRVKTSDPKDNHTRADASSDELITFYETPTYGLVIHELAHIIDQYRNQRDDKNGESHCLRFWRIVIELKNSLKEFYNVPQKSITDAFDKSDSCHKAVLEDLYDSKEPVNC